MWKVLEAMPKNSHPMCMLDTAILCMQRESKFVKAYNAGMSKMDYWDPMFEDACNLMAKLPVLAAFIYRLKYKDDDQIAEDPNLDMGGNFAHQMGIDSPYEEPERPEIVVDTSELTLDQCVDAILAYLMQQGYIDTRLQEVATAIVFGVYHNH